MNNKDQIKPRVTAGMYKGRKLKVPESARPVTERVKLTVFDILGDYIKNKSVLDLFAGSGNMGIEALSRGAKSADFVDSDRESVEIIKANLSGIEQQFEVFKTDYKEFVRRSGSQYDIIFVDPPFAKMHNTEISLINEVLSDKGIIILKSNTELEDNIPPELQLIDKRTIGINIIYFLGKANPQTI